MKSVCLKTERKEISNLKIYTFYDIQPNNLLRNFSHSNSWHASNDIKLSPYYITIATSDPSKLTLREKKKRNKIQFLFVTKPNKILSFFLFLVHEKFVNNKFKYLNNLSRDDILWSNKGSSKKERWIPHDGTTRNLSEPASRSQGVKDFFTVRKNTGRRELAKRNLVDG